MAISGCGGIGEILPSEWVLGVAIDRPADIVLGEEPEDAGAGVLLRCVAQVPLRCGRADECPIGQGFGWDRSEPVIGYRIAACKSGKDWKHVGHEDTHNVIRRC